MSTSASGTSTSRSVSEICAFRPEGDHAAKIEGDHAAKIEGGHAAKIDRRFLPPTLPPPSCWSTVTEPGLYGEYITSEGLIARSRDEPSTIEPGSDALPDDKRYSNRKSTELVTNKMERVIRDASVMWIDVHLFADSKLPVPFNRSFLSDTTLWSPEQANFVNLPDCADASKTAEWLNHLGNQLGMLHGLVPRDANFDASQKRETEKFGDHVFSCEGPNEEFDEGYTPRKSNIFVIDRSLQKSSPTGVCFRWPLVKALVAISSHNNQSQRELIQTIIDDASNIFHSQLHRRYVVGLILRDSGDLIHFSVVVVDRTGAICTAPAPLISFDAISFARVVYTLTFGDTRILGADPKVIINPLTGDPQAVVVDGQQFTIITKISASPHIFGRGTRVYIVKDQHGRFHILKDSWVLASHKFSEIEHVKNISSKVQTDSGLDDRSKILSPRFVAGENHVDDTDEPRGLLRRIDIARIRRRIVTGPIGDPITTYRSRVECLQALIDVVDRLEFFHDKCGVIHGDVSINNIVIVRFLPAILSAFQPDSSLLSPASTSHTQANEQTPCQPTASEQVVGSLPSSLVGSSATAINTSTGVHQPSLPAASNSKKVPLSSPESGGSVIDFDYSCATNTLSTGPTGTLPYMAVELTVRKKPCVRELRHDLESVFLVLLHLARFTCGPPGTSVGEVKISHRIAQWHHESNIAILQDKKLIDLINIYRSPAEYLTDYWAPIAPYIQELIEVVYGARNLVNIIDVKSQATCEAFKAVLSQALEHCQTLSETPASYPPVQQRPVARQKRARPESWSTKSDRRIKIWLVTEKVFRRGSEIEHVFELESE
ncbi:hypothetical protein HYPSUDRAFT_45677 [Hypholoma sublateritium FD-334 SS-4]|uniref:Fungal-type protein kinase domain-containing protein n=1 Tax=Hypholoma sublateritium (strain FD-334 SS-4) TaxID=945553 RepID=A0A0D2PCW0_HYPSF|nr:hypothetical protein HYPSUDRAFT_45677 [Hypholoma sublateritium FD-334 SS-4]